MELQIQHHFFDHVLYGAGLMQLNKPMMTNVKGGSIMVI